MHEADTAPVLAVSGGADSMALAYMFSKTAATYPTTKIAGYPIRNCWACVVDHGIREGSGREAAAVVMELQKMRVKTYARRIRWGNVDPSTLSNIESEARIRRFQTLAQVAFHINASNIFLAHHEDDQHETVLMRLLMGHGYRGLQGISEHSDIPECHLMYGAYRSGMMRELDIRDPYLRFRPSERLRRYMRTSYREEYPSDEMDEYEVPPDSDPWDNSIDIAAKYPGIVDQAILVEHKVPYLKPLDCESGGLSIYRPLLGFGKDRIVATLEANKISWFEDPTNKDQTMTLRNAVRHMVKNHTLPRALQKTAILAMSDRARRRARSEEAEARRWIIRTGIIEEFDPNAGTLSASIPPLNIRHGRRRGLFSKARYELRKARLKAVAAAVVRNLIAFITPETNLPPLSTLDTVVFRLFPELNPGQPAIPTPATMSGVLFNPVVSDKTTKWFLSRTPYAAHQHLPEIWVSQHTARRPTIEKLISNKGLEPLPKERWWSFKAPRLWDGRFWISVQLGSRLDLRIRPFEAEYAKPFKDGLLPDRRAKLEKLLKHYAPGKVRYSLPAIYHAHPGSDDPGKYEPGVRPKLALTMLALPTLGIQLPGTETGLKWTVTYKNVDLELTRQREGLDYLARDLRQPHSLSWCLRRRRLQSWREKRGQTHREKCMSR